MLEAMKRICFLLFCVALPFLASCERNYYEDSLYSAEYDIRSSDWVFYIDGSAG